MWLQPIVLETELNDVKINKNSGLEKLTDVN